MFNVLKNRALIMWVLIAHMNFIATLCTRELIQCFKAWNWIEVLYNMCMSCLLFLDPVL